MKTAKGTKEYMTSLFNLLRSSSVIAMLGSRCETQQGYFAPNVPNSEKKSAKCVLKETEVLGIQIYLGIEVVVGNHTLLHLDTVVLAETPPDLLTR